MNFKKISSPLLSVALSALVVNSVALSAYAEEINIPYTQSENSISVSDDGEGLKADIINIWGGNDIEDISTDTAVSEKIAVNFTVSGLEEIKTTQKYHAYIIGSAGAECAWIPDVSGNTKVSIDGDGEYTAVWNLSESSESVECLILQSDIKPEKCSTLKKSNISLKINYITTIGEQPVTTATETTTTSATTTTSTTTSTTTATTTATTPENEVPVQTESENAGIAVAVMALGGIAVIAIKRKQSKES